MSDAGAGATLAVFAAALLTAAATGLGALPFLVARRPDRSWLGVVALQALLR
jgi:zinc transporter ZupT